MCRPLIILLFSTALYASVLPGQTAGPALPEKQLQQVEALLDAAEPARADSLLSALTPSLLQTGDPLVEADRLRLNGYIALELGDYNRAFEAFQQAVLQTEAAFPPRDPAIGQAHNDLGHFYFLIGQTDAALQYHQTALAIRLEHFGPVHEKVADSYNNLGNVFQSSGRPQQALPYYQDALNIRRRTSATDPSALASALNNLGNAYLSLEQLEKARGAFQQALRIRRRVLGAEHPQYGRSLQNLGNAFFQAGSMDSAQLYFQAALDNARLNYDSAHPQLADLYENLGNCAIRQNRTAPAEAWYQQALAIREVQATLDPTAPASSYLYLGDVYLKKGEFQEALRFTERGWSILAQHLPDTDLRLADAWEKYGLCQMALGHFALAEKALQKVSQIRVSQLGEQHPLVAGTYNNLGNVYWQSFNYDHAIDNYRKALAIWEVSGKRYAAEIADCYSNIGNNHLMQKAWRPALEAFRKALQYAEGAPGQLLQAAVWQQTGVALDGLRQYQAALAAYRKAAQLLPQVTTANSRQQQLFVSSARAGTLLHLYQEGGNKDTLRLATAAFTECLDLLHRRQQQIPDPESRQRALSLHYDIFGGAIACQLSLWDAEKDSSYLWRAFQLSEESKGLLLRERWRDQPLVAADTGAQAGSHTLARALQVDEASAVALQQRLRHKQGLLAFSYGPEQLFWFFLKDGRLQAGRIGRIEEINQLIFKLKQAINEYPVAGSRDKFRQDSLYRVYARDLYAQIWQAVEPAFGSATELIIIPDGSLAYLPFAVLLTSAVEQPLRYRSYPYLLHRYQISYAYSTALLARAMTRPANRQPFSCLAFAPTFEGHDPVLPPLSYNTAEVKALKKRLDATVFQGDDATLANFLKEAPHYSVLHLATHGLANKFQSEFSFLAFSIPTPGVNGLLYVKDLNELRISADLVVMSACESGLGIFQAGEGAVSLGRGFAAAGARSVVSTLWSVNDAKTADFMQAFYGYLQEGLSKDAAIRRTQEGYIRTAPQEDAHPFYWAAFLPLGDMAPLEMGRSRRPVYLYAGAGLLVLIILAAYLRRKQLLWNLSK